jgi:DNA-binding MarR family transcriptional regulator
VIRDLMAHSHGPTGGAGRRPAPAGCQLDAPARDALIDAIRQGVGRDMGNKIVLFTEAAAARLGLTAADLGYLSIIVQCGPLTAGRLAELTNLTSGAVTGMVDRLEQGGFVRREQDPEDRRRVIIRLLPDRMPEAGQVFASSQQAWADMCSEYSDDELRFIIDFMNRTNAVLDRETAKLRAEAPLPAKATRRGRARRERRS